jgi:hypothetical protein
MGLLRTGSVAMAATLAVLALTGAAAADVGDTVRGGGVELDVPDGWARVQPARQAPDADPRTVVVIGTEGVRAVDTPCQVSTYAVPEDGAVVVVVGWREPTGVSSFLPLSGLKLRRGMFQCFADLDYQVNVMVGDRASAETVDAALAAARSIAAAQRRHD